MTIQKFFHRGPVNRFDIADKLIKVYLFIDGTNRRRFGLDAINDDVIQ